MYSAEHSHLSSVSYAGRNNLMNAHYQGTLAIERIAVPPKTLPVVQVNCSKYYTWLLFFYTLCLETGSVFEGSVVLERN